MSERFEMDIALFRALSKTEALAFFALQHAPEGGSTYKEMEKFVYNNKYVVSNKLLVTLGRLHDKIQRFGFRIGRTKSCRPRRYWLKLVQVTKPPDA